MGKYGRLVHLILTQCLDEVIGCSADQRREKGTNKNLKAMHKWEAKARDVILADPVKEKQQDYGFTQFLRSVYPSSPKKVFVEDRYNQCVQENMVEVNLVQNRQHSPNQVQGGLSCGKFGANKRKGSRVVLIVGDCGKESILWVRKTLLLFCLNIEPDSDKTEYVCLQFVEYMLAPHEVDKELRYVHLI